MDLSKNKIMENKTLAQKLYDSEGFDMELFDKINEILGTDSDKCLEDDFVWGAEDAWWDSYDGSVEIVRPKESEWMTPGQIQEVLALGFGLIYESRGEECRYIRGGAEPIGMAGKREAGELRRVKARCEALKAENEVLRSGLGELKKLTMII